MNLVSTYRNSWKRTNVQLVSLACGLALATAVVAGGYEVFRDKESTTIISPSRVAQPIGPVMEEPDFGIEGLAYIKGLYGPVAGTEGAAFAEQAQAPRATKSVVDPHFGTGVESVSTLEGDYLGKGQPGQSAAVLDFEAATLDALWHAEVLQVSGAPQNRIPADAAFATESWKARTSEAPLFGTMVEGVYVMESEVQLP